MSNEISMLILGATISIISSILISVTNAFINDKGNKRKRKFDLVDRVYTERLAAYNEIYSGFMSFRQEIFVDQKGLKSDQSYSNIRDKIDNLEKIVMKNIIYYNEKSSNCFLFTISRLYLNIPVGDQDNKLDNHDVECFINIGTESIEKCLEHIKEDIGLNEIEAMFK